MRPTCLRHRLAPASWRGPITSMPWGSGLDWSLHRGHVDNSTTATGTKLDVAVAQGEQGIVTTTADPVTRVEVGAALTNNDLASVDKLTAETLHAETLGVGVTTVARGRRAFFMCHVCLPQLSIPVTLTWVYF
eukprot:TRINITY_DN30366_c0_g1_i1.p1 TRINITY_DN30366_c0_g1~~TRINITY_DN30366_c0_g1_i1.p1  ORF type:complete len:133 (+),score=10.40 TRINITY_DN30366_c0_g1_i1:220-618(+)